MVENAVVGMSATLAEETAVKDPEDDEAFRAKDKQMGLNGSTAFALASGR